MSKLLEQINTEKTEYQISDLMNIKYGFGLPERDRIRGSVPVYASSGIVGFHNESKVKKASIIIGRKGNVGSLSYSEKESYPIDTVFYVDEMANGFDLKYTYYLLQRINLPRYGGDSAVPGLSRDTVYSISVEAPKEKTQKKIASILGAYDEKIENNNKIIKNLEETAQTIFNEWFVNFKFPGYEKVKMVDSEMGEIPEGWEVGKIEDLTTVMSSGGTPSTKNNEYYNGEISWFSTKELQDNFLLQSEKKITKEGLDNSSAKIFPATTVVMAIYAAPTVGRLGILTKDSTFNQAAVGLIARREIGYEFIYSLLKFLRADLNNMANGAAQQNLNVGIVKKHKIIIPSEKILDLFRKHISPIFNTLLQMQKENISLKSQRDLLLAKLI